MTRTSRVLVLGGVVASVAVGLAACPLPQPLASVSHIDGGTTKTPPRVEVASVVPGDALVRISPSCSTPPVFSLAVSLVDDDTTEVVSARWFVDYATDQASSAPQFSEDVPGPEDPTLTTRALTPFRFRPYDYGAPAALGVHVVELVVSNGFYPLFTDGLPLPNRTAEPGFETQVFRWAFQYDPASANCGP